MNKLKSVWTWIVGIGSFLLYLLLRKSKTKKILEDKVDLVRTHKQADIIEVEVKEAKENVKLLQKEVKDLEHVEVKLAEKRAFITNGMKLTPEQIENYWNKDGK